MQEVSEIVYLSSMVIKCGYTGKKTSSQHRCSNFYNTYHQKEARIEVSETKGGCCNAKSQSLAQFPRLSQLSDLEPSD